MENVYLSSVPHLIMEAQAAYGMNKRKKHLRQQRHEPRKTKENQVQDTYATYTTYTPDCLGKNLNIRV